MVDVYKPEIRDLKESLEEKKATSSEGKESPFWEEMKAQSLALNALRSEEETVRGMVQPGIDTATHTARTEALENESPFWKEMRQESQNRMSAERKVVVPVEDDAADLAEKENTYSPLLEDIDTVRDPESAALQSQLLAESAKLKEEIDFSGLDLTPNKKDIALALLAAAVGSQSDTYKYMSEQAPEAVERVKDTAMNLRYDIEGDLVKMKNVTPDMAKDVSEYAVAGAKTTAKAGLIGGIFAAAGGFAFFKSISASIGKEIDNFRAFAKSWIEPIPFLGRPFKANREWSEKRKIAKEKKKNTKKIKKKK